VKPEGVSQGNLVELEDDLNARQFIRRYFMRPADYVLQNLYRSREEVIAHPDWFQPDSLERIEKAIVYTQEAKAAAEGSHAA
jgi:hypothetical protein